MEANLNRRTLLGAAAAGLFPSLSFGNDFPSRAITIVVPYPPGGATDILARLLQPRLADAFKQSVIIENRGGASTNIGTEYAARAAADGHTILFQAPNIATNEFAFSNLRWKRDDFAPVGLLVKWSNVLVAGPAAPERDFRKLVAASKAAGNLNYGSPGPGSLSHLAIEVLKARTGLVMQHVTYTGPAPMITSLLGGHIQYGVTNPPVFMAHVREGKNRLYPVAVMSTQKDSTIPEIPTLADFGVSGIESNGWLGALVPAKTPPAVIARWNTELLNAIRVPETVEKLRANYLEVTGSSPDEFARFMTSESKKWGDAFKVAGIKPE